jgi:hypothetical protein
MNLSSLAWCQTMRLERRGGTRRRVGGGSLPGGGGVGGRRGTTGISQFSRGAET